AGLQGLQDRTQRRRLVVASGASFLVVGLVAADIAPLWLGQFVDNNLQRPSQLPSYWPAAANYLSSQGLEPAGPAGTPGYATRVLELPGADFSHYRWGATLDPVTPALTDRPFVSREVQPYGTEGSVDLVRGIDRRLQEGVLEPDALAALARKMGVGDILLRSDLQYERFRTPRPRATWQLFDPAPAGLKQPVSFGPLVAETPIIPYTDEVTLGTPPSAPSPPAVAVFGVQDPIPILHTETSAEPMVVAGNGEGLVDLAATGLLSANQPVLYAADLVNQPAQLQQALNDGADLVVTDTNRLQAQRWGSLRENYGYTEQPGVQPLVTDTNNQPLPLFPGAGPDAYTVVQNDSGIVIRASNYGNSVSYAKSERPDLAMDGNPSTTWRVGAFTSVVGERLRVNLPNSVTTDHLTLVQPSQAATPPVPGQTPDPDAFRLPPDARYITKVTLTFDGTRQVTGTLDLRSLRPASGQTLDFPKQTFHQLEIRIDDTNTHSVDHRFDIGVGFAEIRIPSVAPADELLRVPTDLLQTAGSGSLQHRLYLVLTRDRANPAEPFKGDPEASMARTFTLPTARSFTISGTARVSAQAPDQEVDRWLGRPDPPITNSSGRLPGDLNARSAMALDNDPTTWWSPAIGPQEGQWLSVNLQQPITLDHWTMKVVADGQHSVPTRLRIQIDDQPGGAVVDLPPIADVAKPGATVDVPIAIPPVTAQHRITVTVESVRAVQTLDQLSGKKVDLPVGIAELGLPSLVEAPAGTSVPGTCRTDLFTVDGKPVGLRVLGSTAEAARRDGLAIQPCGPGVDATGAVSLGPGP
ncbi:MAG TPA: alpha-(1-_3)-arabinofuranosyltransferase family protein, partial [Acidimicrobiales bacterium]|nr:alpha-(1->3)-arabinofuranosyltransferase family protein [Acidimicrobiales bacterium]